MKVLDVLSGPEKWDKGGYFMGKSGLEIADEGQACKFCLVGACAVAYGVEVYYFERTSTFNSLCKAARVLFPNRINALQSLHAFNDHPDTTFEDVVRVIKETGL